MAPSILDLGVLIVFSLGWYALLLWLANKYSIRTHWQPPAGNADINWTLRHYLGLSLGAAAMVVCAIAAGLELAGWPARLLTCAQAALMAAAGASDLRRFHLPLPLTLGGILVAVAATLISGAPLFAVLFALLWAIAVIALHAITSKGSMQLGDHIATLWIALASPFNGLLAVLLGDCANVLLARVKGLRGKKVAAAGAWLMAGAALMALPPYFAWFSPVATGQTRAPITPAAQATLEPSQSNALPRLTRQQNQVATVLITLTQLAGDETGRVALPNARAERITAARNAAVTVARLAAFAQQIAPGAPVTTALADLVTGLDTYNVDRVRAASEALRAERERLTGLLSQGQPPILEQAALTNR
jgi:hypothetical protein